MNRAATVDAPRAHADSVNPRTAVNGPAENAFAEANDRHLFTCMFVAEYQQRWQEVRRRFPDDPRAAVEEAHALASQVISSYRRWCDQVEGSWRGEARVAAPQLRAVLDTYESLLRELIDL